jgi:hypothetical protein
VPKGPAAKDKVLENSTETAKMTAITRSIGASQFAKILSRNSKLRKRIFDRNAKA